MKKIWNWFVGLLDKIRRDRLYHFIVGMIAAMFCLFVFKMYFCVWPVVFLGFLKECIDSATDGNFDWFDLLATVLGGLVLQAFVWLCIAPGVPFIAG